MRARHTLLHTPCMFAPISVADARCAVRTCCLHLAVAVDGAFVGLWLITILLSFPLRHRVGVLHYLVRISCTDVVRELHDVICSTDSLPIWQLRCYVLSVGWLGSKVGPVASKQLCSSSSNEANVTFGVGAAACQLLCSATASWHGSSSVRECGNDATTVTAVHTCFAATAALAACSVYRVYILCEWAVYAQHSWRWCWFSRWVGT